MSAITLQQPAYAFRSAMSLAVTGVNIVTTDGPLGRYGLTVSAVSSVSTEPPMILVCVNQKSIASNAIRGNGAFAINVLANGQQSFAETFSGSDQHGGAYEFDSKDWLTEVTGSPVLKGAVASFDCEVESAVSAATHTVFIGRVLATAECPDTPLIYTDRRYGKPDRPKPSLGLIAGTKTVLERFCG
jgi:flavin reductase